MAPTICLACSCSVDKVVEGGDEFFILIGLDYVGACTKLYGTLLMFGGGARGQDNQWKCTVLFLGTHGCDQLVAVHTWHFNVKQDGGWRFVGDHIQSFNAIAGHLHFPAMLFEHIADDTTY